MATIAAAGPRAAVHSFDNVCCPPTDAPGTSLARQIATQGKVLLKIAVGSRDVRIVTIQEGRRIAVH
jgi:hypothetical protein